MCGIFGGIGQNINPGIIRALAIANRERGTDSLGFFDNSGKSHKAAMDPIYALSEKACADFIDRACHKGWFVAGHTRHATHGKVTKRNAHPFRFGRIIGSHNGIVDYPYERDYEVDSEYLFDELNKAGGDYQKALEDISGYWGLSWFDGCNFWLSAFENKVFCGRAVDGNWYYSSDFDHLTACIGHPVEHIRLHKGRTIRFALNKRRYERMPDFRSKAPKRVKWDWRTSGNKYIGYNTSWKSTSGTGCASTSPIITASTHTAPDVDPAVYDDGIEYSYLEDLAIQLGYGGAEDFMKTEGFNSVRRALDYLEFHSIEGYSKRDVWEQYADFDNRID